MGKTRCMACEMMFTPHPNVPGQKFCGATACQRVRRCLWRKRKLETDPAYQENRRDSLRAWQEQNPDYYREYRRSNPAYASRNREKQRDRDRKRRKSARSSSRAIRDCLPK